MKFYGKYGNIICQTGFFDCLSVTIGLQEDERIIGFRATQYEGADDRFEYGCFSNFQFMLLKSD